MKGFVPDLPRLFAALAAVLAAGMLLTACAGADRAPAASAGDCALAAISTTGWHANLYLPADAFEPGAAPRRLYPDARWFVIGWGDARAYQEGVDPVTAITAIAWPGPSVMQVIALDRDPRAAFMGAYQDIALSDAGLRHLAARLDAAFQTDADGAPIITSEGQISGASVFAASHHSYHGLNTCNVWTARKLRAAGAPILAPAVQLTPQSLGATLRGRGAQSCAALD